ncbi:UV-B-induced protein At3g17800, chloroplastic-like [Populus nigra]|uniref:UV-B-induced protein At3g17800, chloroplastic-like n=1 Tax=Populus nigra TaxID=3691 RepID=UPI002B27A11E|nr:UV-B-induced protein At3g17800, chloroplastic-like [Populus nigra]
MQQIRGGAASEVLSVSIPSTSTPGGALKSPQLLAQNFHSLSFLSPPSHLTKRCPSFGIPRLGAGMYKCRPRSLTVRASGDSAGNPVPVSPLEFESPVGQLLAQILQTHPHLLPAAIDQQLENLQTDRDAQKEEAASSQDFLYKRIAEVKEKERRKALEEIIYSMIVHKFLDNDISMIPKISPTSDPTGRVDFWPNQEQKLESVHSPEAFEMIQSHLSIVLGERLVGPLETTVQISKIKLGKLYAASLMYGYFLRRVDQRYQLERAMNTLPKGFDEDRARFEDPSPANRLWDPDSLIRILPDSGEPDGDLTDTGEEKSYRLRSYVMYLDAETLQRYATIRSKEAISLIEKQTQALFGRPDIRITDDGSIETANDEVVSITFSGLTMLVLEAVGFGSFLWDAESYVESKYHFFNS